MVEAWREDGILKIRDKDCKFCHGTMNMTDCFIGEKFVPCFHCEFKIEQIENSLHVNPYYRNLHKKIEVKWIQHTNA